MLSSFLQYSECNDDLNESNHEYLSEENSDHQESEDWTEIQKMRIAQKMKIVKKLKTIKIHLHSMKWKLVYDDDQERQLDQWSLTVQFKSSIFYVFWML